MATGVPPGTQAANTKSLGIIDQRLAKLDDLQNDLDQKMNDPAYSTDAQQAQLAKAQQDITNARDALQQEKEVREELDEDLSPPADKDAARDDLKSLDTLRKKTYPKFYKGGSRVANPCMPCIAKEIKKVKPALAPKSTEEAANDITGIFEGGQPDYCAVSDSPTDLGKLSYGKHQASETSGNLHEMLQRYANSTDPAPDPDLKSDMDSQLDNFSDDGKEYTGTAQQRTALKKLLKKACKDPAMQKTQDDFFRENFYDPAIQKADKYGVKSPIGEAMYYDMYIQGDGLIDGFSKRALKKWADDNGVDPPPTACKPKDPNGPDEKTFLYLVDDQRRQKMENSTSDYHNTQYRPDGFDKLLDQDNMNLDKDYNLRGQPVKGIPPAGDYQSPAVDDATG